MSWKAKKKEKIRSDLRAKLSSIRIIAFANSTTRKVVEEQISFLKAKGVFNESDIREIKNLK